MNAYGARLLLYGAIALALVCTPVASQDLEAQSFFRRCNSTNTCPPGYYAEQRSPVCRECVAYTFKNSSTGCCSTCKPPSVVTGNRTVCAACPYPTVPNRFFTACECPAGSQAVIDATTGVITGCDVCPLDTINPAPTTSPTACKPCPGGTTAGFNQTRCLCPAGSYVSQWGTNADGSLQIQCQNCSAGSVAPTPNSERMCVPCGAGASTNEARTECVCPAGFYASYKTSSTRARFAPGFWPPGFNFNSTNWGNWFSDKWWRMFAVCKQCQGETITSAPNSNSSCEACPAGLYGNLNHTACEVKCPAGSQDVGSDPLNPDCQNCTDNTVNPIAGGTCSRNCSSEGKVADPTATKCVCPAGYWSLGEKFSCRQCDGGRVAPKPGSLICSFCQPLGSHIMSSDGINCNTCEKGYFNSGNATTALCNTCAAGYYKVGGRRAARLAAAAAVDVSMNLGTWCWRCSGRNGETTPDNNTWSRCCVPPKVHNGTTCV